MELRHAALDIFLLCEPHDKVTACAALWAQAATLQIAPQATFTDSPQPGRPATPLLVDPKAVPRRSPFTPAGHAALMHSVAHIEFNAINLALDAIWRFADMPSAYYQDWLCVAAEEAQHFRLLDDHLRTLGYAYGDFEAHDGLWTMCEATRHDVTARMGLVPRTLEARGLDATPLVQAKLRKVGTPQAQQAVAILDTILHDEVGHVAKGNHWYHWLCQARGLDPEAFYAEACHTYRAPRPKPPYNLPARRSAGFTDREMAALLGDAAQHPA